MIPEEWSSLLYTIEHFTEIAQQNRFAIGHEASRCLICRPECCPTDPFVGYQKVITESIKVRRPRLDQDLVEAMNGDLELMGASSRISMEELLEGNAEVL